jgi:uncharacterized protein YabN with tetrapyrrole methylase and pyrophosphatase domain
VEEAYELADAAGTGGHGGDGGQLGDVLFQVLFLSLLLEERGEGDLAAVAESCAAKLIRRHPHVYGERDLRPRGRSSPSGREIKRDVEGGGQGAARGLPENLPSLLYARKVMRRIEPGGTGEEKPGGPSADPGTREETERVVGELLLEAVAVSRTLGVDPELALRAATRRMAGEAD